MPIPSPFHPRTSVLCTSYLWKEWAGYHAVRSYETSHEREYLAFRHGAGLLDVSPLCKYEVKGPDAGRFLAYVTVKDVTKLGLGRVTYLCWCDPRGHVLDDGTITRWDDDHYRMTSADPSYAWLHRNARGFEVEITDVTEELAALALQGPNSRAVLAAVFGSELESLRFFRGVRAQAGRIPVEITRTGYTGDLGYEIWIPAQHALAVWDALVEAGAAYGLLPAGLDALDVTRVEAGFILGGIDYTSARKAVIPSQRSTPQEIGLGWAVGLERDPFIGQAALCREAREGARYAMVGLDIDWDELEHLYDAADLPPDLSPQAWRSSIPVYHGVVQVGYASSGAWSPTLKKNLAIATVEAAHAPIGTELAIEWTVDHARKTVKATVVPRPFFDPPRKRANVVHEAATSA
ncbi:MAG: aminomethyl transferase family protein [Planctomycetota bacterium]|nr:MAG: aminomethyl transferase family protein [Planctomycetota bacterium]